MLRPDSSTIQWLIDLIWSHGEPEARRSAKGLAGPRARALRHQQIDVALAWLREHPHYDPQEVSH